MSDAEVVKDVPVEIELIRGASGLGFNIRGGIDIPQTPGENGIYVTKIRSDGSAAADGRLQNGDKIIKINGQDITGFAHSEAVNMFRKSGNPIVLTVYQGSEARPLTEEDSVDGGKTAKSAQGGLSLVKYGSLLGLLFLTGTLAYFAVKKYRLQVD
ncbi:unnamed protein product [Owenia fusiformis]|uniref:Uncharacterized protein n=1 Tax=Owenia fusiformis TaxID=6347 RepID=A0A8J1XW25_OWEFU|nr:unnamed protein product [Owenia fusiformis]